MTHKEERLLKDRHRRMVDKEGRECFFSIEKNGMRIQKLIFGTGQIVNIVLIPWDEYDKMGKMRPTRDESDETSYGEWEKSCEPK